MVDYIAIMIYTFYMDIEELEQLKESSIGHSLIKAARLFNEIAFDSFKQKVKLTKIRPSHLQLFAHIPYDGITIVNLAKKVNISKQAVSTMVKDLLAEKVLIKSDNPEDKRSFLIKFNSSKKTGIYAGLKHLKEMDQELIDLLGPKNSKELQKSLLKIINKYN